MRFQCRTRGEEKERKEKKSTSKEKVQKIEGLIDVAFITS